MRKWLLPIILILLCVVIYLIYAFKPVYVYDLSKNSEPNAQKILYEYVLRDLDSTPKTLEENFNIVFDNVYAFEYDLNDDGEKEVIGIVYSTYYWGTAGYSLFILQKKGVYYEDISYILNIEPQLSLKILKSKANGYSDIEFHGSSAHDFSSVVAIYENGKYFNDLQFKILQDELRSD